jgi:hypothetical protein
MDYLVYVEYNAENLQFFLWYGDYVRRFDALPEKEKALSPEWMPEAKDLPNLSNDGEKGEKKRTKRDTLETAIDTGYDSKTAAFFDNESEFRTTPTSPGHHISVMKGNGSTIASSVSESTTPSTVELTSQAGLKWQTCRPTLSASKYNAINILQLQSSLCVRRSTESCAITSRSMPHEN